jgi:hypothetical protein
MTRAEERRQAWVDAQSEKINSNGMRRDQSPLSTRTAAEINQTMNATECEPAPRDHSTAAGCAGVIQFRLSVRERAERAEALKRDEAAPKPAPQQGGAIDWAAYNERYRAEHGEYPQN